ncbi:MAG: hypothetical protein CVU55_08610 [Deltaproteobacteria bacterium HGW-Deltaproteobacteria-13]|jgi:hypothetical protein|nr:MAG: hypothetical protein CVU55_08610 [Deltaproteobacteria bacterium HGW-Deltaproteobacteria-13]
MKRFWLVLLSLGLVMAFSVSAFAVDVKVSGEYYAAGLYLNKTNVNDTYYNFTPTAKGSKTVDVYPNVSTAFFYQRLRVGTDFIVSPGLKLVTRFDAMERIWGGTRNTEAEPPTAAIDSAGSRSENENIAVDWAYINYVSPIGTFDVGYMNYGATGTIFGNSSYPAGRIKYNYAKDAFTIGVDYSKIADNSYSNTNSSAYWTDGDKDVYGIEGTYKWKDGKAGMKINYYRYADKRPDPSGPSNSKSYNYNKTYFLFTPYATAKIGPVALQAEFNWATGNSKTYDDYVNHVTNPDVKLDQMSGWIDATATFAPVYVGATIAYVSGDDPGTLDREEGGTLTGGNDWNPCLIMFNTYDVGNWVGNVYGYGSATSGSKVTGPMANAWFGQGRIGIKPNAQLDAMLSVSHAFADKKPTGYANAAYGTEVDLTGTYKITNNLSYMLGVGYLFTGDYFKAQDAAGTKINDDFIIVNKLTLSF